MIQVGWVLLLLGLGSVNIGAVVVFGTDDPQHNTSEPEGNLAASGWALQGQWGNYTGTPVAPNYFLTAAHVGGRVGDAFLYQGTNYVTSAAFDDPKTDLRLWRVCGEFPTYADLQRETNEVGRPMMVFGRGTQRGGPVEVLNDGNPRLQGWRWGPADRILRWGTNLVTSIVDGDVLLDTSGIGPLIQAEFNRDAGFDECHLSGGDSGGAVFIRDDAAWRLAGINYSVDGPYRFSPEGDSFWAFLFDHGGLYAADGPDWHFLPDSPNGSPSSLYATRVSDRLAWIDSVLALPLPPEGLPALQVATAVGGPYRDDPLAEWDVESQSITTSTDGRSRFYRLHCCRAVRIESIEPRGEGVRIVYAWLP